MNKNILVGQGRPIIEISSKEWEEHLAQIAQNGDPRISFMSDEHRPRTLRHLSFNNTIRGRGASKIVGSDS